MQIEMRPVRIGIIGLGPRGETLLASILAMTGEVEIVAVCDLQETRISKILGILAKAGKAQPKVFSNYMEMLALPELEGVLIPTSWNSHLQIARDALAQGKYAGIEVGGATSLDELWQLVHAAEATGVSCMMLENCCYGHNELLALNLARKGLFGELVHCSCGYEHDLAYMACEVERGFERALHNLHRNCDLYPTHGLGPIAKILRINRGNRFVSLTSTASKACGFAAAAEKNNWQGCAGHKVFNMGDVVTTVIRCAHGETITMTHSVSLPRPYSRCCRVQGTKGLWLEDAGGIFIDGISPTCEQIDVAGNPYTVHKWNKVEEFYQQYDHPIWQEFRRNPVGGHGGMDTLTLRAFLAAIRDHAETPIDVYDCAAWMSITCLSEQSIALGGMPMPCPDFTNGKWINRPPAHRSIWCLDEVYEQ
mgnify:CR=1 FL=1